MKMNLFFSSKFQIHQPLWLLGFSLLMGLGSCQKSGEESADTPPNIVIIFADDLGYGDLSCYGQQRYQTPHLDQMAKEGIRFTNFYVAQPVCSASRAALLTGCYPNRVGVSGAFDPSDSVGLHPDEVTIAELVKQQDYATAMYGKWHLGHLPEFLPTRQGFDEYFGLPYSNDMWPFHPERPEGYPDLPLIEGETVVNPQLINQDSLTVWYTQRAVDFIDRKKGKPFFLYLAHNMPHVPLFVSDNFRGKSGAGLYGDVIMEIDWSVGQVMTALERNGLTDNTLVIFTSDNGPWLSYGTHSGVAGPLREGKGTVWEGGVRVPCIAKWPGKIPAGAVQELPLSTIDILPTLAHWLGLPLPAKPIDGKAAAPVFLAEKGAQNPHDAYYFYHKRNELHAVLDGQGQWKLMLPHLYRSLEGRPGRDDGMPIQYNNNVPASLALYDLRTDIGEATDQHAAHPDIAAQLQARADSFRQVLGDRLKAVEGRENRPLGKAMKP